MRAIGSCDTSFYACNQVFLAAAKPCLLPWKQQCRQAGDSMSIENIPARLPDRSPDSSPWSRFPPRRSRSRPPCRRSRHVYECAVQSDKWPSTCSSRSTRPKRRRTRFARISPNFLCSTWRTGVARSMGIQTRTWQRLPPRRELRPRSKNRELNPSMLVRPEREIIIGKN